MLLARVLDTDATGEEERTLEADDATLLDADDVRATLLDRLEEDRPHLPKPAWHPVPQ